MNPRVVIADDHVPMREMTAGILDANGFSVVGQADDAAGAVALVQRHDPDVCLLDINMPGDGIEAARLISATHPEFAQSVRQALPAMRFHPAILRSKKVPQLVEQPFMFKIIAPAPKTTSQAKPD
jgi:DNA-binding NarL/FixJ family response regulator